VDGVSPTLTSALLPFAPVLHVAWADGRLTPAEFEAIACAPELERLDADTRSAVTSWLLPGSPPSAASLAQLHEAVRNAAGPQGDAASLAELGLVLARQQGAQGDRLDRLQQALRAMETALGVAGAEAARSFVPLSDGAQLVAPAPSLNATALNGVVDPDHVELRGRVMRMLERPEFASPVEIDRAEYRAWVLERCRALSADGVGALAYPAEFGGRSDVAASIAVFETLAHNDLSLLVKYGVQFGLFAGSIFQLGTRSHHVRFLARALTLELPGCFAMTETAHGSNVRDVETTATYDRATDEFIVHTPHQRARKDYIGNAALHGRMATVFAQLIVGGQRQGVHALLVPLRDDSGSTLRGVQIEDCGAKEGLNGIDNGRIAFDRVRVPRDHLLDRFGSVGDDGVYTSPIASATRRFFTMLGTLVSGRVSIGSASVRAARVGLSIAVRYAHTRRQFGPEGSPEVPILDYLTMQRRLLPRVATAYALGFAARDLIRRFSDHAGPPPQEIEVEAAGFKAYASDFAVHTLLVCRQACGGQGYLAVNRLPRLLADADVFTTFEGDNTVLAQLVAKGLLTQYREQFGELRLWGAVRWVTDRAASALAERNPIATRRTDEDHLLDPEYHASALDWREARLLDSLARRLRHRIEAGEDSFAALNACQDHAIHTARAHTERLVLGQFHAAIAGVADEKLAQPLRTLCALFALHAVERDAAFFLAKGYLEGVKAEAIRTMVNRLCGELRPDARPLVDAFGIPDAVLAAPIALR
jgi:acyl-CoA oxidase